MAYTGVVVSAVPLCISGGCGRKGFDGKACDWSEHRRQGYFEGYYGAGAPTAVSLPSAAAWKSGWIRDLACSFPPEVECRIRATHGSILLFFVISSFQTLFVDGIIWSIVLEHCFNCCAEGTVADLVYT